MPRSARTMRVSDPYDPPANRVSLPRRTKAATTSLSFAPQEILTPYNVTSDADICTLSKQYLFLFVSYDRSDKVPNALTSRCELYFMPHHVPYDPAVHHWINQHEQFVPYHLDVLTTVSLEYDFQAAHTTGVAVSEPPLHAASGSLPSLDKILDIIMDELWTDILQSPTEMKHRGIHVLGSEQYPELLYKHYFGHPNVMCLRLSDDIPADLADHLPQDSTIPPYLPVKFRAFWDKMADKTRALDNSPPPTKCSTTPHVNLFANEELIAGQ